MSRSPIGHAIGEMDFHLKARQISRKNPFWRSVRQIGWKRSFELYFAPVNSFSRYREFLETVRCLEMKPGLSVLDVGSPKVFGLILSLFFPGKYLLSDVWEDEIVCWRKIAARAGLSSENISFQILDARQTGYPGASFQRIFLISVIEHIEGEGDISAVREMARLLTPDGILVITVPFARKYKEQRISGSMYGKRSAPGKAGFFQRIYDWENVEDRLLRGTGLALTDSVALGIRETFGTGFLAYNLRYERNILNFMNKWNHFLSMPFSFAFPDLSRKSRFLSDPRRLPDQEKYYLDLILKFRKSP